jgi:hypothetical protein
MGLEDELREQLRHAKERHPKILEAEVTREPVESDYWDVLTFSISWLKALEAAVLRLAQEIDRIQP